jgi:hypothetical protein
MKFEIEADIPETHEPTGEFRSPERGDSWLAYDGSVGYGMAFGFVVILREKWKWPAWLKADYIEFNGDHWFGRIDSHTLWLESGLFDFTPPPGDHKPGDRIFNPKGQLV